MIVALRWLVFVHPDGTEDAPELEYLDNEMTGVWLDVPIEKVYLKRKEGGCDSDL